MKCDGIIEGQINIFDLPIIDSIETNKKINSLIATTKLDKLESIIIAKYMFLGVNIIF